jgi:hypothetical protein
MSDRTRQRDVGTALRAFLDEQAGAARYAAYQQEMRNAASHRTARAHPQEFDENGFPLPQRNTSFLERVARLINPT